MNFNEKLEIRYFQKIAMENYYFCLENQRKLEIVNKTHRL